jgi:hypothetical protein
MLTIYILNDLTNILLINLFLLRTAIAVIYNRSLKKDRLVFSILTFLSVLVIDNWLFNLTTIGDMVYYIVTATVFLPFAFLPRARPSRQIVSFIGFATLLYLINSEILIQTAYIASIIVILIQAKTYFLQSSKLRYVGIVLSLIAMFVFFKAQQFTFMKLCGNWAQSKYLIYFSICDYIVFTTMLLVIHANFRRLFFN